MSLSYTYIYLYTLAYSLIELRAASSASAKTNIYLYKVEQKSVTSVRTASRKVAQRRCNGPRARLAAAYPPRSLMQQPNIGVIGVIIVCGAAFPSEDLRRSYNNDCRGWTSSTSECPCVWRGIARCSIAADTTDKLYYCSREREHAVDRSRCEHNLKSAPCVPPCVLYYIGWCLALVLGIYFYMPADVLGDNFTRLLATSGYIYKPPRRPCRLLQQWRRWLIFLLHIFFSPDAMSADAILGVRSDSA